MKIARLLIALTGSEDRRIHLILTIFHTSLVFSSQMNLPNVHCHLQFAFKMLNILNFTPALAITSQITGFDPCSEVMGKERAANAY